MTPHAKLARVVTEEFVNKRSTPFISAQLAPELNQQKACFVYIHTKIGNRLRSMYGQVVPHQKSLGEEIVQNTVSAIQASSHSLHRLELSSLKYTIAVLEPLQRISDPWQIDPNRDGVLVRSNLNKEAVILPDRAGIDSTDDLIATAIRESGVIPKQEVVTTYRFPVTYFE